MPLSENLQDIIADIVRTVFGGGSNINAANPLPVDTSPGSKSVTTILEQAAIAAAATTVLENCAAIDLTGGPSTLSLTIKAIYNAAATLGIRLHILTSPTNAAAGTHTGGAHATILTDATAHWVVDRLVGLTVLNTTDSSEGVITANTVNTVTVAALAGGTANAWALNDVYSIPGGDYDTVDWDSWNPTFVAGAVIMQTEIYAVDPAYVKVLVENLDPVQTVTIVEVVATVGP